MSHKNMLSCTFSFSEPNSIPILLPIRGVLRGSVGRSPDVAALRGGRTALTTCADIPLARRVLRGGCTGSMGRKVGAIGWLKRREGRLTLRIEFRRTFGRRGCRFATSSKGLGNAGLNGRRGGDGHIIWRAALGCRATTTVGDIFRDTWNGARRKGRGFGCPSRSVLGGLGGQGVIARAFGTYVAAK